MKNIVLEDVGEFTQVQFRYFSVHTYSVSVREDKKVMSSKFITKGPIVVLGGAWAGGCCVLVRLTPSAFSNLT